MFKVRINSKLADKKWGASFSTLQDAESWIKLCSEKKSKPWGSVDDFTVVIEDVTEVFELQALRSKRNNLLKETDFIFLEDGQATKESKDLFVIYRQELRDITDQPIDEIVWPVKPEYIKK